MQYVSLLLLLLSPIAHADTRTKVAVVDTGMPTSLFDSRYLCSDGHKDISGTGIVDRHGHGSMIARDIARNIDVSTHCILIVKWIDWGRENIQPPVMMQRIAAAIDYAVISNSKYINLSLNGPGSSEYERQALTLALMQGVVVTVAAGNDGLNLSHNCDAFPACYAFRNKNFIVVANYRGTTRQRTSNYGGPVNAYEYGPTGTSESAAIFLGKYIRGSYENKCIGTCPMPSRVR